MQGSQLKEKLLTEFPTNILSQHCGPKEILMPCQVKYFANKYIASWAEEM